MRLRHLAVLAAGLALLLVACGSSEDDPPATPTTAAAASRDTIRIPSIGVDAPLSLKQLVAGQPLPSPDTPYDVALYDFGPGLPGMGGAPGQGGNVVLAGQNAALAGCVGTRPPCVGVFGLLSELQAGAEIDLTWKGTQLSYQVTSLCSLRTKDFADGLYHRTSDEQLTLLTGAGALTDTGWSQVLLVIAKPAPRTAIEPCPAGTEAVWQ